MSSLQTQGVVNTNAPNKTIEWIKDHKAETALSIVAIAAITAVAAGFGLHALSTGAAFNAQAFLTSAGAIAGGSIIIGFGINGVKLWNKMKSEDKAKDLLNEIEQLVGNVNNLNHKSGDKVDQNAKVAARNTLIKKIQEFRSHIMKNEISLERADKLIDEIKETIHLNVNLDTLKNVISGETIDAYARGTMWDAMSEHEIQALLKSVITSPLATESDSTIAQIQGLFDLVGVQNASRPLKDDDYVNEAKKIKEHELYANAPEYVKANLLKDSKLAGALKAYVLENRSGATKARDLIDLMKEINEDKMAQYAKLKAALNGSTKTEEELKKEIADLQAEKKKLDERYRKESTKTVGPVSTQAEAFLNITDLEKASKDQKKLQEELSLLANKIKEEISKLKGVLNARMELDKFLTDALSDLYANQILGDIAKRDIPNTNILAEHLDQKVAYRNKVGEVAKAAAEVAKAAAKKKAAAQVAAPAPAAAAEAASEAEVATAVAEAEAAAEEAESNAEAAKEAAKKGFFHQATGSPLKSWFGR
jgi:hypothetical protein